MTALLYVIDGLPYRMAWEDTTSNETGHGEYLFESPEEARATRDALKSLFPMNVHYLEDRNGQRVEIPS